MVDYHGQSCNGIHTIEIETDNHELYSEIVKLVDDARNKETEQKVET